MLIRIVPRAILEEHGDFAAPTVELPVFLSHDTSDDDLDGTPLTPEDLGDYS